MDKFGYTKTQISLFSTVRTLAQMASLSILADFYKKLTLRQGMTLAAVINISGYYVYALADKYWLFLLGNFLVGFGYGLSCMIPLSMVLERWFYKDRTMAVSMCSAASGLATIGVPSVITGIVQTRGLTAAFLGEGIVMTLLVALSYLIIRSDPRDSGMHAYGELSAPVHEDVKKTGTEHGGKSFKGPEKALIILLGIAGGMVCSGGWTNLSLHASCEGYSAGVMAAGITAAGAMLMVCKFLFGLLSEKITLYKTSMLFSFLMVLGSLLLIFAGKSMIILFAGYGIFGGAISMVTIGNVSWTGEWAAPEEQGRLKSLFQLLYSIGGMSFIIVSGMMADHMGGSYVPSYIVVLAACVFIWYAVYRIYKIVGR